MKTKDFKSVKEAKGVAIAQLEFYNEMMAAKDMIASNKGNEMSKKKLFVVDTISTFKQRYVIEAESLEHAYDEVTMRDSGSEDDNFEEFSQKWLGETIIDGREIKRKHFDGMLKDLEKTGEGSHWMGEDLIRKIDYDR